MYGLYISHIIHEYKYIQYYISIYVYIYIYIYIYIKNLYGSFDQSIIHKYGSLCSKWVQAASRPI